MALRILDGFHEKKTKAFFNLVRGLFGTVRRETVSENLEHRLQRKQKVTYLLTYLLTYLGR